MQAERTIYETRHTPYWSNCEPTIKQFDTLAEATECAKALVASGIAGTVTVKQCQGWDSKVLYRERIGMREAQEAHDRMFPASPVIVL